MYLSPEYLPGSETRGTGDDKAAGGEMQLASVSGTLWAVMVFSPNPVTGEPGTSIHPLLKTQGYRCCHTPSMNPVSFCRQPGCTKEESGWAPAARGELSETGVNEGRNSRVNCELGCSGGTAQQQMLLPFSLNPLPASCGMGWGKSQELFQ